MSYFLVSNISGVKQNYYTHRFWDSHRHNVSVFGDQINYFYLEGTPKSQPIDIEEREKTEGYSYLSKVYSLLDCVDEHNPEYLIWLDATVQLHEPFLEKSKSIMDKDGVMLLCDAMSGREWWTTDRFFDMVDETREDFKMPEVVGGLYGFKMSHPMGVRFFTTLLEYAEKRDLWFGPCGIPWEDPLHSSIGTPELSLDPRVKGHRHDQCVMGYMAVKYNFKLHDNKKDPIFYNQQYIQDQAKADPNYTDDKAYYFPYGAPATHHPTNAHFSGGLARNELI